MKIVDLTKNAVDFDDLAKKIISHKIPFGETKFIIGDDVELMFTFRTTWIAKNYVCDVEIFNRDDYSLKTITYWESCAELIAIANQELDNNLLYQLASSLELLECDCL